MYMYFTSLSYVYTTLLFFKLIFLPLSSRGSSPHRFFRQQQQRCWVWTSTFQLPRGPPSVSHASSKPHPAAPPTHAHAPFEQSQFCLGIHERFSATVSAAVSSPRKCGWGWGRGFPSSRPHESALAEYRRSGPPGGFGESGEFPTGA